MRANLTCVNTERFERSKSSHASHGRRRRWTVTVKDIMHKGAVWVSPETPVSEIARKMRDGDIGAMPVRENNRLIGMVTDRDIVCRVLAAEKDAGTLTAGAVMSKPIITCREDDEIRYAASIMEANHVRRLPVVDEHEQMVGMLSVSDLAHWAPHTAFGEVLQLVSRHHD
jgi:CBS domain-containing protein